MDGTIRKRLNVLVAILSLLSVVGLMPPISGMGSG
jgi:hypothetical protein